MTPNEALQYLSAVASDFARTLPPSSQGPTVQAINQALAALAGVVNAPAPAEDTAPGPRLSAVPD